ncbi:MAG: hypothetical protein GF308_02525 [Candidatus Heimdallarchaeota archaeon]|nr:hypothetical protein [Candidatus Heimdallarchaeota archaeon]
METVICAGCSSRINFGSGYLSYSVFDPKDVMTAVSIYEPGTKDLIFRDAGLVFYCERCANQVFTEGNWLRVLDPSNHSTLALGALPKEAFNVEVKTLGVAYFATERGLTPSEARQEARQFAQLWWQDNNAAHKRIKELLKEGSALASSETVSSKTTAAEGEGSLLSTWWMKLLIDLGLAAVLVLIFLLAEFEVIAYYTAGVIGFFWLAFSIFISCMYGNLGCD